ncbi:hypothetical protein EYC80_000281 [Monilinia laxa]|uniref:C2H2-type domain-containing protein n=1 Tax=Monilinia laxa TaxID=61186 RepID=A0A5N6KA52_MONLA|nr:hypothetical protein EYC80_000281 [Monilinia laxa]
MHAIEILLVPYCFFARFPKPNTLLDSLAVKFKELLDTHKIQSLDIQKRPNRSWFDLALHIPTGLAYPALQSFNNTRLKTRLRFVLTTANSLIFNYPQIYIPSAECLKHPSDSYAESVNSSWDTSLQLQAGTSASSVTRRTSFDETVKMEDLSFHGHNGLPERYASTGGNAFCAMSAMTQDMLNGFQESNMFFGVDDGKVLADKNPTLTFNASFQSYAPSAFGSFESQCPSSDIPSLMDDLYSPTSTTESSGAIDFVDPTQTTLVDTFAEFQSSPMGPLTPVKFGTPSSDFNIQRSYNNSPAGASTTGYLAPPNYQDLRHDSISPIRQQQLRRPFYDSPQSTAALQRIQAATPTKQSTRRKIKRQTLPIPVHNKAKLPCTHPGCNKRFQRQEHLKRHEHTHNTLAIKHKCPFCEKRFGRTDNLKSHVDLHRKKDRKASRTKYHPDADEVWESMDKKSRKHQDPEPKSMPVRTRVGAY